MSTASYKLYWEALSGALLPQVMFAEMNVAYQKIPVDMEAGEHKKSGFLLINPTGQIPALQLPEGTVIGESAAIAIVLGERHPESGLVPQSNDPLRPIFLRWLMYMAASVYMTIGRVHHPERFAEGGLCIKSVEHFATNAVNDQFRQLNDAIMGDPWFLPTGYSALDIYLTMLADFHPDRKLLFSTNPKLEALCKMVESRPAYIDVIAQHRV